MTQKSFKQIQVEFARTVLSASEKYLNSDEEKDKEAQGMCEEAIAASRKVIKDWGRDCKFCGLPIDHLSSLARYCNKTCRDRAKYHRNFRRVE
jgi:hypothetical protein